MGDFVFDLDYLAGCLKPFIGVIGISLPLALGFGSVLEILSYGIFKAFGLLDIKKY